MNYKPSDLANADCTVRIAASRLQDAEYQARRWADIVAKRSVELEQALAEQTRLRTAR
jgi:hypothetical protein